MMTHIDFFLLLLSLSCVFALIWGAWEERGVASIFIAGAILSYLLESPQAASFRHIEMGVFLTDLGMYAGIMWIMLQSDRFWPMWMTGMQGVQVLSHALGMPGYPKLNLTYAIFVHLWGYPMTVLLLVVVVVGYARRMKTASQK